METYVKILTPGIIMFPFTQYYFYYPLSIAAIYPTATPEKQASFNKILTDSIDKLKLWADNCPDNFLHKYWLVDAERQRLVGNETAAMDLYDRAIACADEHGFLQNVALANEVAARFWLAKEKTDFAQLYLKKAHYHYQQWGAVAKVKTLEEQYPWLTVETTLNSTATSTVYNSTSFIASAPLDFHTIIKASQTISKEIVLNRLLEKMMLIVIENAGAQRGVLLLPKQGQWFIEAESNVNDSTVNVLQSIPIDDHPSLATTVIHYVARTQESVVLNNATVEGNFVHDPYFIEQQTKSVLCAPLLNQGQLAGILYLENHITTGAFTPQRLQILNLLSSQMAISIENARFCSSMARFLPSEFLKLLDKTSIIDIQLGDQIEKEMTVLFSDIRDFTSLSEKMTPQDNFNFINAYLSRMEPIIHENHGFIDKYIGDAIMALFPNNADDAVQTALSMLKALADYNLTQGNHPVHPCFNIGIGIHTGKLMLGTVGGQNRMDGTVISDAVNLASRIEGMTKTYHANLLISEATYSRLNDHSKYTIRPLDEVKAKGKTEAVMIYAVSSNDCKSRKISGNRGVMNIG